MLEKHQPAGEPVWDTNNLWLAFLFLCLCWVAVMVVIIHRDVINQKRVSDLIIERAQLSARLVVLEQTDPSGNEAEDLRHQIRTLGDRTKDAETPPTALFVAFGAFEVVFILAYWFLLYRLRSQIRSLLVWLYLATLPFGFVYFFLLITVGQYHTWSELFGDMFTTLVALYFFVGLVALGGYAAVSERAQKAKISPRLP